MKKIFFLAGALTLSSALFAQKATQDSPFSLEGQLSYNSASLAFNAPALRMRYFFADDMAARVSLMLINSSTTNYYYEEPNNEGGEGTEVNKSSMTVIAVGVEKHFSGTDKMSPYFGGDFVYGMGNSKAEWDNYDGLGYNSDASATYKSPTSMLGINLVAGNDFYFAQDFYIGLELGIGFQANTIKATEFEFTSGGTTTTTLTEPFKSTTFGNNYIGNFRLGWRF